MTTPELTSHAPGVENLPRVAYFCMEFGLSEKFPIYSGGLGILAGDYMKSAGDLEMPVVGIGLLWNNATHQVLDGDGNPTDEWRPIGHDFLEDTHVRVRVRIRAREVECRVWRVSGFGIAPLYLIEPCHKEDRWITDRLYDTRPDCRVAQEMLLGIGGVRALSRLGLTIDVFHFNEGHAVFAGLELIADRMSRHASFEDAWRWARERIVFTTHTPVPAGNETHPLAEIRRLGAGLELVDTEVQAIGGNPFGMTVAGLRLSRLSNAVAQLHGETARKMWAGVSGASPIIAITNGVHQATWQAPEVAASRRDAADLWAAHDALKRRLFHRVDELTGVRLKTDALTIGFARRAAGYKRADLILSDPARIGALLNSGKIQIIFSGKAHPADGVGKDMVARLTLFARKWPASVVFLEDYDMAVARQLVSGADIWLNNPQRPHEASGTSGMKAALNGVLNLSVLDGWWPEGCVHGQTGWAIGGSDEGPERDARDAGALYEILEQEVLPAYAERAKWTGMMQASIEMAEKNFTSHRMVREYYQRLYVPTISPSAEPDYHAEGVAG
ncbi:MAG: alpha-glucan family phosphorylase [Candidatus Eisenbacteria bacterium]|nr:alpha-glucan family phosphorylase [Candidatus Eisenbacteria bacterium]